MGRKNNADAPDGGPADAHRGTSDRLWIDHRTEAGGIHQVVGYMPQRFGLYEDLSVNENLTTLCRPARRGGKSAQRDFREAAAFTALVRFTDRLPARSRAA